MEGMIALMVLAAVTIAVFAMIEGAEDRDKWHADWRCASCDKSYGGKDIRKSSWRWVVMEVTGKKAWMCSPCYNHQHHGGEMPTSLRKRLREEQEADYLTDQQVGDDGQATGTVNSQEELLWLFNRIWDSANGSTSKLGGHEVVVGRDSGGRRYATLDGKRVSKAKIEGYLRELAEAAGL